MKKTRNILLAALLLLTLAAPLRAQMFMMDGEENLRTPENPEVFADLPGDHGSGADWYVPVGDGVLLLAALGGAYLLKRKKDK